MRLEERLQLEKLNYMKLKKWMVEQGCIRQELDRCNGKAALLQFWLSDSGRHALIEARHPSRATPRLDTGLADGCSWNLEIVRALLRGTHDDHSPLRYLRACSDITEIIVSEAVPEVFLITLLAEMLKFNPHTTEAVLWQNLTINARDHDGTICEWDLRPCKLSVLPEMFGDVRTSGDLWLSQAQNSVTDYLRRSAILLGHNNQLTSLPDSFGSIQVGGSLGLDNIGLTSLPASFGPIKVGENIDLSFNLLSSLPESFGSITVGPNLNLSQNQLSSLLDSFPLITVGGILDLSSNQLSSLPESFGSIKVGRHLQLQFNQLISLPDSFGSVSVGCNSQWGWHDKVRLDGNQLSMATHRAVDAMKFDMWEK